MISYISLLKTVNEFVIIHLLAVRSMVYRRRRGLNGSLVVYIKQTLYLSAIAA